MLKYLRLIRFNNLLIIALSQVLVRYCLILPAFLTQYHATGKFPPHLSAFEFSLLVVSTILIAAAGYIINDVFDIHIDEVNKPGKNIIGKSMDASTAKKIYYALSGLGVAIGFYLAFKISKPVMGILILFTAVSLWMYSSFYKRRLFTGNIIISLLCALSILIVGLFEPEFYGNFNFLLWFAIPAFLLSMIRELIKDIEDVEGDELSQCKTAPIILGINKTKIIIISLIILTTAFITNILFRNFLLNKVIFFWYLEAMFFIPLAGLAYLVISAGEKKDFHYASIFTKVLMLCGIIALLPFWYYFLK